MPPEVRAGIDAEVLAARVGQISQPLVQMGEAGPENLDDALDEFWRIDGGIGPAARRLATWR